MHVHVPVFHLLTKEHARQASAMFVAHVLSDAPLQPPFFCLSCISLTSSAGIYVHLYVYIYWIDTHDRLTNSLITWGHKAA